MRRTWILCLAAVLGAGCAAGGLVSGPFGGSAGIGGFILPPWVAEGEQEPEADLLPAARVEGMSRIAFVHTSGTSPCPQVVGTLSLVNAGAVDLLWESFSPSEVIEVVPDAGLIEPGRQVRVEVLFNCDRA
ncbi:MAG: hypothetical protein JSU68_04955, partial [Phycisphaerales bacterium]